MCAADAQQIRACQADERAGTTADAKHRTGIPGSLATATCGSVRHFPACGALISLLLCRVLRN
jgi:hypothetical protein